MSERASEPPIQQHVTGDHASVRSAQEGLPRVEAVVRMHGADRNIVTVRLRGAKLGSHRVLWIKFTPKGGVVTVTLHQVGGPSC